MNTAIIGGGAAGYFCAANLAEMCPDMQITIYEQSRRPLRKVELSGGGRCNCTNTFAAISNLNQAYPRGARLMSRLFHTFGPQDTCRWFEQHGVPLTTEPDGCIFPAAQDSHAITGCLMQIAHRHNIRLITNHRIDNPTQLLSQGFDHVVVTTGGQPRMGVPSLFTLRIDDDRLHKLMGIVVPHVIMTIPGTKHRADGPLLITHWGLSGPATLRLSSYAARHLAEQNYKSPLIINWTGTTNTDDASRTLSTLIQQNPGRHISNLHPFGLQTNMWTYLTDKAGIPNQPAANISQRTMNRMVNLLTNDRYDIAGRSPYRDEFVTCGGIPLTDINPNTLESRLTPNTYYAGEVLDIDGITGGFDLQAAWTTGYCVAHAITQKNKSRNSK